MSIDAIKGGFEGINGIDTLVPKNTKTEKTNSFGDMLESAMKEVNDLQVEADQQIDGMALKKEGVSTHSAMVALEKADVAFQLMSAIRGKIIRAYEEVIRTQV